MCNSIQVQNALKQRAQTVKTRAGAWTCWRFLIPQEPLIPISSQIDDKLTQQSHKE